RLSRAGPSQDPTENLALEGRMNSGRVILLGAAQCPNILQHLIDTNISMRSAVGFWPEMAVADCSILGYCGFNLTAKSREIPWQNDSRPISCNRLRLFWRGTQPTSC